MRNELNGSVELSVAQFDPAAATNLFLYGVLNTPAALYDRLKPEGFTAIDLLPDWSVV
ncbi:MAG: hypothetical protein AAFR51_18530 [Pseudomonadota bacterium]